MVKKLPVLFLLYFNITVIFAQTSWDSTRYVKYNSRLIVSLYQSYRQYNIEMQQFLVKDSIGKSKLNYFAQANNITGIELNYDKINVSFGFKSTEPTGTNKEKTGSTKYFNLGLNIGGNRWLLETAYRRYQGFYDKNSGAYDTSFKRNGVYYQDPKLINTVFKAKFLYLTNNKKFAFKSGYSSTYRQIKTAASWVLTANAYYNTLNTDSSFFPKQVRSFYGDYRYMRGLDVFAFSVYAGASVNLVAWRAFFVNATLLFGPEEQWRVYKYTEGPFYKPLFYSSVSGDLRFSFGLNMKRFFITITSISDICWYKSNAVAMLSKYVSGNFTLGYRFKVKTPKFYQKIQQSNLYKKF
jgi:hypothetical protein